MGIRVEAALRVTNRPCPHPSNTLVENTPEHEEQHLKQKKRRRRSHARGAKQKGKTTSNPSQVRKQVPRSTQKAPQTHFQSPDTQPRTGSPSKHTHRETAKRNQTAHQQQGSDKNTRGVHLWWWIGLRRPREEVSKGGRRGGQRQAMPLKCGRFPSPSVTP